MMPRRFALLPLLLLGACASTIHTHAADTPEPPATERLNRGVYAFNRGIDRAALKPATQAYRAVVPAAARRGVSNLFGHVDTPVSAVNAVLQGKVKQAFRQVDRFLLNTVLGLGVADHASDLGRPEEEEDFGQTLAIWGVKPGPYLMVPLLGPSTVRDLLGFGVDVIADPVPLVRDAYIAKFGLTEDVANFSAQTIDLRLRLLESGADRALAGSADEYATIRSAYHQRRRAQIYNGNPPGDEDDYDDVEPLAPVPAAPPQ